MQQPSLVNRAIRRVGVAVAAAALPAIADAQIAGYPVKPVRIIVPFSAGSPVEIPARPVAQRLAKTMGQQFLIDNRTGASGTIGMGGPRRTPILPDVPTFQETGLTGFDVTCYHGVFFPVGVPAEIVRRLHAEVAKALALPEVRKHYADNGLVPIGNSPEEFAAFLIKDVAHQASIAKQIGIQPQ
mgnify:CR=1 FL=1